jgi:hypothetical protein
LTWLEHCLDPLSGLATEQVTLTPREIGLDPRLRRRLAIEPADDEGDDAAGGGEIFGSDEMRPVAGRGDGQGAPLSETTSISM